MSTSAAKYTDFTAGKVVEFSSSEEVNACWTGKEINKIAKTYFGTKDALGRTPEKLYAVASVVTFGDLVKKFSNFGAFFWDSYQVDAAVAKSNQELGSQYVYLTGATSQAYTPSGATEASTYIDEAAKTLDKFSGCHLMLLDKDHKDDLAMVAAWIASRDYTIANGSGTIDYTEFSDATPTVDTSEDKDHYDGRKVNYIGHVQQRGINRSFYQRGVNMDGIDLGAYMDSAWIQSEIEAGWINMALGATKIPANEFGLMRVRAMVVGVAERGLENGCILPSKPLTNEQQMDINAFANEAGAATSVMTNGYFISTRLFQDTKDHGKWTVQYTLIYSKGDHIEKISGQHILV